MAIKISVLFLLSFLANISFCQTEVQRKYSIGEPNELLKFVTSSGQADSIFTQFHSKSIYYDVYLDTPDKLLLKRGLSLRFRKRIIDSIAEPSYSFQLKSEMLSANMARMEVEEKELSFYLLKSEFGWISMTSVLDSIFHPLEKGSVDLSSTALNKQLLMIELWIQFKAGGAVSPFQKLLNNGFLLDDIKQIKPVIYGKSIRYRSHVYSNVANELVSEKNRIRQNELPVYFQENDGSNWLLESSFDLSTFYKINEPLRVISITEFEVENKFFKVEEASKVLSIFEKYLEEKFDVTVKLDSKYKQAATFFE